MKAYRAALVGLGNIAWQFDLRTNVVKGPLSHAGAYCRNKRVKLVGGYSPDAGERKAFEKEWQVPAYASIESLLEEGRPELVSICSPSGFHFEQAVRCIEYEIPMIWLEKPPAETLDEVDELLSLVSRRHNKSTVLVSFQRRYDPNYRKLRVAYEEGLYGGCKAIQVSYSKGLEHNGSHMLDIMFFIVGDKARYKVKWVSNCGRGPNPSFCMVLKNGVHVMVTGLDLPYHCNDVSLVCDKGRLSVLHGGMTPVVETKSEHELFPGFYRLKASTVRPSAKAAVGLSFKAALADLIRSHETGFDPCSNLKTARRTQALISEIRMMEGRLR